MQRQDQRGVLGNTQVFRGNIDSLTLEPFDLLDQRTWIDHYAIADHGELPASHHARRQKRQLVGGAIDDQRVPGIMSALKAHDDVGLLGEPVNDLALALVSPLGANHDHIGHAASFLCAAEARIVSRLQWLTPNLDLDAIADARPPSKRDGVTHAASRRCSNVRIPKQPLTVAPGRSTLDDLALSKAISRQDRGEEGVRGSLGRVTWGEAWGATQTRAHKHLNRYRREKDRMSRSPPRSAAAPARQDGAACVRCRCSPRASGRACSTGRTRSPWNRPRTASSDR